MICSFITLKRYKNYTMTFLSRIYYN